MANSFPLCVKTHMISDKLNKTVYYPQVIKMKDKTFENFINRTIVNETEQLINLQIANMPTPVEEMLGLYEVKNNQRDVLSLSLSNYTYHYQAAHGMTYKKSLTYDLLKKQLCKLEDLFKLKSNYIEKLSEIIQFQIEERNIPIINSFTSIRPNQDFYIADKVLVIYFQLYEITPYVFGFPMFPISVYDIQDIINENGPLGRMMINN